MLPGGMMDFPLTLPAILERAGKLFAHVEVVSGRPDKSLVRHTYGDIYRRARQLAAALQNAGIRAGDRVATLMWNHSTHLEAYFGVPACGAVLHTLNLRLHPAELAYIANHARDRFLIVDDVLLPVLETFRADCAFERILVVPFPGQPRATAAPWESGYEEFLRSAPDKFAYPEIAEAQGASMCYTSGTTGKPKGVLYSHRALVLHSFAACLADAFAFSEHDVVMTVGSMFHANGWGFPYAATMAGSKQVLPGPHVDGESLLNLLEGEQVTFASGVPTLWVAVLDALDKNPGRWKLAPRLRIISAGSAVPEFLFRRLDAHGVRVVQAWGMTETSPIATIANLSPDTARRDEEQRYAARVRQGRTLPFVEIRATDDEEQEIAWDDRTLGELQVRGPWVAGQYFEMPEADDRWTIDGWFRTGDVVSIDARGSIRIADRSKDLIKSGGEWISSVDVENALMAHPAVKEAGVIGVPHPKWQERPLAVVVLRDGAQADPSALREFLLKSFAKWQVPDAFVYVKALPRTSVGKVLKRKLREDFQDWKWDSEADGKRKDARSAAEG